MSTSVTTLATSTAAATAAVSVVAAAITTTTTTTSTTLVATTITTATPQCCNYGMITQVLFCSRLCPSTAGSSPPPVFHLSLSFAVLVHTPPCCPTMSSLQRRVGLPTDLTPSVCHSVFLIVHLLSFIWAMCPAHFHFVLVSYWTMRVILFFA